MLKKENGITLIALVITVIILLILAVVAVSAITGNSGLFTQANKASEAYSQESAKEKLELTLLKMQMNKVEDSAYNADDYLTSKLESEGIIVTGDIVIVGGYNFEIDRNALKIKESMGKGTLSNEIKITATSDVATDFTKSTITIEIETANNIETIKIAGRDVETIPAKQNDKYTIIQEIENNGNYSIFVQDENGAYQTGKIEVKELAEDIVIHNVSELVAFRDKVNAGATFENRTVILAADIDLSSVCHAGENGAADVNWIPMGSETAPFKGIFDGGYHTISNLYYKGENLKCVALFAFMDGIVENLKIENGYVNNMYSHTETAYGTSAIIVGESAGGTIRNCMTTGSVYLKNSNNVTISSGTWVGEHVGGVVGGITESAIIINCYNLASVSGESVNKNYRQVAVGGITGSMTRGVKVINCYNFGSVTGTSYNVMIGGIVGGIGTANSETMVIENSYNIGQVTKGNSTMGYAADICGRNGFVSSTTTTGGTIRNCYCFGAVSYYYNSSSTYKSTTAGCKSNVSDMQDNATFTNTLGDAFVNDVKYIDSADNTEKWKYNNGYPVLRWQIEELR